MSMYAKVVADSISPAGIRLTTLELYYPLMIHAQAKTHRLLSLDDECYIETNYSCGLMDDPMLSRNAQSNRAMPVAKMLEQVREEPAMPSHWGENQPGMSADVELTGDKLFEVKLSWLSAASDASQWAELVMEEGLHKQVANRLTMPFQYIKVIVTATEWDSFFKLRLNDADPTMMELAGKMKEAMQLSEPAPLTAGEWHLPYVDFAKEFFVEDLQTDIKCSVARCARVSYNNHDNSSPDVAKDIALADRLLRDGHMSPFEHQATPMYLGWEDGLNGLNFEEGVTHLDRDGNLWSGNFRGWIQYRQTV